MNILNLYKFKKKIGQNYLIFNLKFNFDLCSGYNYFNFFSNEIDFLKSKFINNKNYLNKNINFYCNFLLFNYFILKLVNINISFNITKIFLKKIKKVIIKYFKILINQNFLFFFKKFKIIKLKIFLKKFFFPFPKIDILKIFFKKKFFKKINNLIIIIKKNVFFKKI